MKKILITGANSYIGTSFEKYMSQWPEQYQVDTVDMVDGSWREKSFAGYDSVFHVAGIAHRKETPENAELYYQVNRDLTIELAEKAKKEGVAHFIFMSSMSVYGMNTGVITKDTVPQPTTNYGKSKYAAEMSISTLTNEQFCLAVLRPPMVYGKNCRGNFQMMLKLVKICPVFPSIRNQRSMISISNLCAFLHLIIDRKSNGVFCPQNKEYVNTTEMAQLMAKVLNKKVFFSHLAGLLIQLASPFVSKIQKAFGTLKYQDMEQFGFSYCEETFEESVRNSI